MIINSLLDNDWYKFTMLQAVLHNYYTANVKYRYMCRTKGYKFSEKQVQEIITQVKYLCTRELNDQELYYIGSFPYIKPDLLEFLKYFKLDYRHVTINDEAECGLNIEIEGPWASTILFEVPILAIVSEIAAQDRHGYAKINEIQEPLKKKIDLVNGYNGDLKFADFGTRRRFSYDVHTFVVNECRARAEGFVGTSNVWFAYNLGLKPIGTMAHEWLMMHQALGNTRLKDFQKVALEVWAQEYRGELGIALTDTVGVDAFLRDFDLYLCKLFDGVRHDSGCPKEFGGKILDHYRKNGIDPMTKTIVFSDGLNFELMVELYQIFSRNITVSFGIGTNLTNDIGTHKPLSMVIKAVECNGQPVAKIPDSPGKTMDVDADYLQHLKRVFGR